jgi:hypothetical protein
VPGARLWRHGWRVCVRTRTSTSCTALRDIERLVCYASARRLACGTVSSSFELVATGTMVREDPYSGAASHAQCDRDHAFAAHLLQACKLHMTPVWANKDRASACCTDALHRTPPVLSRSAHLMTRRAQAQTFLTSELRQCCACRSSLHCQAQVQAQVR